NLTLLAGWHDSEETGWRWTEREFSAHVTAGVDAVLTVRLYVAEESIRRLGRLTLMATANGRDLEPAVYDTAGSATYVRRLEGVGGSEIDLRFRLDGALEPEESDSRQRGLIVASIQVS